VCAPARKRKTGVDHGKDACVRNHKDDLSGFSGGGLPLVAFGEVMVGTRPQTQDGRKRTRLVHLSMGAVSTRSRLELSRLGIPRRI